MSPLPILGVKELIVGVNKMDKTEPPYSEARFDEIAKKMAAYLEEIGYRANSVPIIPISGWHGDNILDPSQNMGWYNGWTAQKKGQTTQGKTLIEAIDVTDVPIREVDKPFRLPVQDVYNIAGIGTVSAGFVDSGVLQPGMLVNFSPGNVTAEVESIRTHKQRELTEARPRDYIDIRAKNCDVIEPGMVVSDSNDPAKESTSFLANVWCFQYVLFLINE